MALRRHSSAAAIASPPKMFELAPREAKVQPWLCFRPRTSPNTRRFGTRILSRSPGWSANDYRAMGAALDATTTVAEGKFHLREVRAGLLVHASDARYEHTVTTRMEKHQSLKLFDRPQWRVAGDTWRVSTRQRRRTKCHYLRIVGGGSLAEACGARRPRAHGQRDGIARMVGSRYPRRQRS